MLTFYFFAPSLSQVLSTPYELILFYFSAIIVAALYSYFKQKDNPRYISVGASGGVSAVVMALVLYSPWATIYISFFFPIYYILYAIFFVLYSLYMDKKSTDNVAHDVHMVGAVYGLVYMMVLHPESIQYFTEQITHPPFLNS